MARKTTIEYSCDSCGADVASQRDLQRFTVRVTSARRRDGTSAYADMCDECETRFLATAEPFFPASEIAALHAMSREEE